MTAGTTLPTVKSALVARLQARPGLAGVQVHYTFPGDFAEGYDGDDIWLGRATSEHNPLGMRNGGAIPTIEEYRLTVYVQTMRYQDEGQEATDLRAGELLTELQQELAVNPQTTPEILAAELVSWDHIPGRFAAAPTACGSRFEIQVRIRARLVP